MIHSTIKFFDLFSLYRKKYATEAELRAIVFHYIEVWYNRRRRHSKLGYVSSMEFKKLYTIT